MIRRVLFGIFWFGVFTLALLTIGGGIAGASASGEVSAQTQAGARPGFSEGYQVGVAAGAEFRERYGRLVVASAAVLAAAGSFVGLLPGTRKQ